MCCSPWGCKQSGMTEQLNNRKGCIPEVSSASLWGQFSEIAGFFIHFLKETFPVVLLSSTHSVAQSIHFNESYYV